MDRRTRLTCLISQVVHFMPAPNYTQPSIVKKSLRVPLRFLHFGTESGWRDPNEQTIQTFEMSFMEMFGVSNQRSPALMSRTEDAFKTYQKKDTWEEEVAISTNAFLIYMINK